MPTRPLDPHVLDLIELFSIKLDPIVIQVPGFGEVVIRP